VVNGSVYGAGIFFDEILDAVLARTVRSKGRAGAAAPGTDTVSASRCGMPQIHGVLYAFALLAGRRSLLQARIRSRAWRVVRLPTSSDAPVVRVGRYE
jgi:hypothetical protein